ncbi:MAG: polymerase beta domain protein region protein [Candidatus Roizmanbacteria bacterium GW2011_GWC2_34_23]|uniref:Polymerase beta domain protein region protein n=1 Tax=Candidatus Roizmanbacteria bacterium GW2011_GWC2_34_23 TaxID=1618484 RepID=A0A0G0E6Z5_9BACT|nr:MAG: polymerase beta domain protein region protein [Candidatus Roizmanbacteria bacterium GW2011_GWC2_34_23]
MKQDIDNIINILQGYKVKKAALFGSYARGDNNEKSDIDILIEPANGTTLFDMAGMQIDLQDSLKKSVDVVTYGSINPMLKDKILKDEKVIYQI